MAKFCLQKDPRVYARGVVTKLPEKARVLGLDLGTNCGASFADILPGVATQDVRSYLDQWDLSIGSYDSGALRHLKLRAFLEIVQPDLILFENVKYDAQIEPFVRMGRRGYGALLARVVPTAEFIGGLKTTVSVWAEERNIPCQPVEITEIKRYATGKGNASKVDMINACNKRFGTEFATDDYEKTGVDNIADSAFLLMMGVETYLDGLDVQTLLEHVVEQQAAESGHPSGKKRKPRKKAK